MQRRALTIYGTVQGVGFRPFVHGLAQTFGLSGFVQNQGTHVRIEVEGQAAALDQFAARLISQPPPLAHIERVSSEPRPVCGRRGFRIDASASETADGAFIAPDIGTCDACLAELFDPGDRRYRYAFNNCTNCGPRLTIVTGAPYDRERTTMAGFAMCPQCAAEYENPADRRFHAQPIACPACGPHLSAFAASGAQFEADEALAAFVHAIADGRIGAMKGLGGYHLVCDARDERAVAGLRQRKHREEKPFAIILPNVTEAQRWCEPGPHEADLLASPRRPIVLLRKRAVTGIASAVAPGNPMLGVMLPYTPLHYLLMHDLGGIPLVMTSGNRSDEPIVYRDDEVIEQLKGIGDIYLTHNRPIHLRCDDSVMRMIGGTVLPVRRSRGYAPQPIRLHPQSGNATHAILAVGAQSKNTFALVAGEHVFLSQHIGDLGTYSAYRAFERDVWLYEQLVSVKPRVIACDMHPDYASTRYALRRAQAEGLRALPVQHHHAHMASCMVEHELRGPVIGVIFDGTGYGNDGAVWGGEFLIGDCAAFRRASHLREAPMPGGERAIREPWRMALAHLVDADASLERVQACVDPVALDVACQMLQEQFNTPMTSSMGRLFDAVASLVIERNVVSYEGQAAIELEHHARAVSPSQRPYPYDLKNEPAPAPGHDKKATSHWVIDTRPLIRAVVHDLDLEREKAIIAHRFHVTVAEIIVAMCQQLRTESGINDVVLSGGVFLNALLTEKAEERLRSADFAVYRHSRVPPGDGGISLGQAAIAAAQRE